MHRVYNFPISYISYRVFNNLSINIALCMNGIEYFRVPKINRFWYHHICILYGDFSWTFWSIARRIQYNFGCDDRCITPQPITKWIFGKRDLLRSSENNSFPRHLWTFNSNLGLPMVPKVHGINALLGLVMLLHAYLSTNNWPMDVIHRNSGSVGNEIK